MRLRLPTLSMVASWSVMAARRVFAMTTGPAMMGISAMACAAAVSMSVASAQTTGTPAKPSHNQYTSPLETLKSSRLWTDVPPARDFVRESRPDPKRLDFTPLTGRDPERPKPRDKANVEALQAELERDGASNARKMDRPRKTSRPLQHRRGATGGE